MRKQIFLLLTIILFSTNSFGQKEAYNWYFGYKVGINFHTNPPSVINNSAIEAYENCVSISDSAGNLLFYCNGEKVWDKTHQVMQNGDDLYGSTDTHKGLTAVEISKGKYMLYTLGGRRVKKGFCYSIIDMSYNNGKGAVILKNQVVDSTLSSESLMVVNHQDSNKFWVIICENHTSSILSYLVTDGVINTTPLAVDTVPSLSAYSFKLSPREDKVVFLGGTFVGSLYYYKLGWADFDISQGTFSNYQVFYSDTIQPYHQMEFSHDGRYLYTVGNKSLGSRMFYTELSQFDLSAGSLAAIGASKKIIYGYGYPGTNPVGLFDISLGPDKKIYVCRSHDTAIGIINKPYRKGDECDYDHLGLTLSTNWNLKRTRICLPTFNGKYYPDDIVIESEGKCPGDTTRFTMITWTRTDSVKWTFDDPTSPNNYADSANTYHIYTNPGRYTATFLAYRGMSIDTLFTTVNIVDVNPVDLGPDTFYCDGSPIYVDHRNLLPASFKWSTGREFYYETYFSPGTYWVEVTDTNQCVSSDTVKIVKEPVFRYWGQKDFIKCEGDTLTLNVGEGADAYDWSTGDKDSIVRFTQSGKYFVDYTLGKCKTSDSIDVDFKRVPVFELGNDITICSTDSITLNGTNNASHQWNVGDTNQSLKVKQQGLYILTQNTPYCEWKDTIQVDVQQQPSIFIGNDTVVCIGQKAIIGSTIPNGIKYTWNFRGDGTPKITADSQAIYSVIAFDGVCRAYDTVFVGVYTPQSIELGADTTLCQGTQTLLNAKISKGKYQWNTGSRSSKIAVKQTGQYYVKVIDSVCQYSDTIDVTFKKAPPPLDLGADTTLCQDEIYQVFISSDWERVQWDDGNTQYSRIFITEGAYEVAATYLNCQETDKIQIGYHPALPHLDLGADVDVCDPLFYPVQANYNGYYPLVWNTGAKGNYIEVTETGDYIVSTAPHRCGQASDTIHVTYLREKCDHHFPSAFSPNGDGINDYFMPVAHKLDVELMRIFNRWGELIYEGTGPWNGTYHGVTVQSGVYMYYAIYYREIRGGRKKTFTQGTVHVVR